MRLQLKNCPPGPSLVLVVAVVNVLFILALLHSLLVY